MGHAKLAGKGSPTKKVKELVARSMYERGKHFIGAGVLLRKNGGYEYVVLHLLCQGIEILLKSFLLFQDFDKYWAQLKTGKLRHNLENISGTVVPAFKLKKVGSEMLKSELKSLNVLYSNHLLRYSSIHDVFLDPSTIPIQRVLRRTLAAIRLANRRIGQ